MNHIFGKLFAVAMILTADALPAVAQQTIKFDESGSLEINDAPMMSVLGVLRHVGHRVSFEEVRINTKKDYYFDEKGLLHWKKKKISLTIGKNSKTQELLDEITNLDDSYTWFRVANEEYFVVHPTKQKNESSNETVLGYMVGPVNKIGGKMSEILINDLKIQDHSIALWIQGSELVLQRVVSLKIKETSFMDALNILTSQYPDLFWELAGLGRRILYIGTMP